MSSVCCGVLSYSKTNVQSKMMCQILIKPYKSIEVLDPLYLMLMTSDIFRVFNIQIFFQIVSPHPSQPTNRSEQKVFESFGCQIYSKSDFR